MKKFILLFLFTISATAQIKGVVRDSITKEPIAYVSIFTDEKHAFQTEQNGSFTIDVKQNSKLTFHVFGYQSRTVQVSNNLEVFLKPKETEIEEIQVIGKKNSIQKEIDIYESSGFRYHNYHQGYAILIKNDSSTKPCTFLSKIKFHTYSNINNSKLKMYVLNALPTSTIGEIKIFGDSIITVKKGHNGNEIDVSKFNIQIPQEGIFLCFENLLIDENKYYYQTTGRMSTGEKKTIKQTKYEPEISVVPSDKFIVFNKRLESWEKAQKIMLDHPKSYENLLMRKYHNKYLTPSIKITLTN